MVDVDQTLVEPDEPEAPLVLYYSIHGNDKDGWRLGTYKVHATNESVTEHRRPEEFEKLKDLLGVLVGNGDIDT